jgi:hypothetical protein
MTTHLFQRAHNQNALVPADSDARQWLWKVKPGETIKADVRRSRNPHQHNLWHVLVRTILHHQSRFSTHEQMHRQMKIWLGYYDDMTDREGNSVMVPKSIAYDQMPPEEFKELLDAAIRMVTEWMIPNTSDADLRQHLAEIVGVELEAV